jgi:hypothetical protein
MSAPIPLRQDFEASQLRGLAKRSKDGPQARRLLALAAIYDGATRTEAAKIGGVGLQIIRDWVLRFNARGPDALVNGKSPGQPSKLNELQRQAIADMIERGPIPAVHGVVPSWIKLLCSCSVNTDADALLPGDASLFTNPVLRGVDKRTGIHQRLDLLAVPQVNQRRIISAPALSYWRGGFQASQRISPILPFVRHAASATTAASLAWPARREAQLLRLVLEPKLVLDERRSLGLPSSHRWHGGHSPPRHQEKTVLATGRSRLERSCHSREFLDRRPA